jgi:hypothetical protein
MNKRSDYNDSVSMIIWAWDPADMAAILAGDAEVASEVEFAHFDRFAVETPCFTPRQQTRLP